MLLSFASKLLMHTPSKFTEITVKVGLEFGKSSPLKHNIVCLSYAHCSMPNILPKWKKTLAFCLIVGLNDGLKGLADPLNYSPEIGATEPLKKSPETAETMASLSETENI